MCIDHESYRLRHADSVGHLYERLAGHTGSNEVFGNVPGSVGRRTVNFGSILAGKSAAAMGAAPPISIHDDLPAGEARITVRPADHKHTRRVDQ